MTETKQIETFEDGVELSDGLGDTIKADFISGKATYIVRVTAEKGTLDDGTNGWDNPNAIYDLIDSFKVETTPGEFYNIPGEALRIFNIRGTGEDTNDGAGNGQLVAAFAAPVPASKMDTARVRIDLAQVSDISDGTTQTGTTITVSSEVSDNGVLDEYNEVKEISKPQSSTGEQQFKLQQSGTMTGLLIKNVGNIDELSMKVPVSGGSDYELVDDTTRSLLEQQRKENRGSTDIPAGWLFVPLSQPVDFDRDGVSKVQGNFDLNSTGDILMYPVLNHEQDEDQVVRA